MKNTNFPDEKYLNDLVIHLRKKYEDYASPVEKIITYSGAVMNWIGDYISDENMEWSLEDLNIKDLYLTGTHPEWNKIIIDKCERSSEKLKELIKKDKNVFKMFSEAKFIDLPILIRFEDNKYKVLDGMHRVIASIRDDRKKIKAYVAKQKGELKPKIEPHVIYDLMKAYGKEINEDLESLIMALKFLKNSYSNVEQLLKERFNSGWVRDEEAQKIIKEVLKK
jgi:hypothetical protein